MLSTKLKAAAGNGADATLYVDDVFSTYLYTGNGSTQTITNGIDLAGKGGMVWIKNRSLGTTAEGNRLVDSLNSGRTFGWTNISESTNGRFDGTVNPFLSNGFTLDSTYGTQGYLTTGSNYASWTFRKAAKFFDVQTVTHTNGTANNIDLSVLGTVGMVIAKITSTTGDWTVWHRGLTAGNNLQLNLTNAQSTTNAWLSVSGTTATLAAAAPTGTYVIYAYAHDTSSTGIIQCGSAATDSSGNWTTTLGYEPQWILIKSTGSGHWEIYDTMRGMPVGGGANRLFPNTYSAEADTGSSPWMFPTATGFQMVGGGGPASGTIIYMAIRRPNKPPTLGTQVYNAIARTGTGAAATVTGVGFAPDLVDIFTRNVGMKTWVDRLRGVTKSLQSYDTAAEVTQTTAGKDVISFDMDGFTLGPNWTLNVNGSGSTYINYAFKRAPGFFDVVCYTSTQANASISHNLTVVPELILVKCRSNAYGWFIYSAPTTNASYLSLESTAAAAAAAFWQNTTPTATQFFLNSANAVNGTAGQTYVAYLFATLAGIQYINSYVGDGTTGRVINCGFSAGARFICIKATSTTGSWWVWDSARGITSTNDPALQLNSTAAEITSADAIDPSSSGFIVNQEATCSINASGVSYLVWAIA